MLNRVSKQNNIGFLETDYKKLGDEVKAINDKYNTKEEKPVRLSKQTSGNIYKQKSLINFLEENNIPTPEKKAEENIKPLKPQKLGKPDIFNGTSKSVASAKTSNITDIGGPTKHIKNQTGNSIFDPDNIAKQAKSLLDNREKTKSEKIEIEKNRRLPEQQRMSEYAEALAKTDLRKDSQISSISTPESTKYKDPPMSIFDNNFNFNRIPEKTQGEEIIERSKQERQANKENPYLKNSKVLTSKDVLDRLFNNLTQQKKAK